MPIFATMLPHVGRYAQAGEAQEGLGRAVSLQEIGRPPGVIEQIESASPSYVPSEGNTALLAEALRVPAGALLTERDRLVERLGHRDGEGAGGQGT